MPEKKTRGHTSKNKNPDLDRGSWIQNADRDEIIAILDHAPCGIVINDASDDRDVLYINHESFNLMGYSVSEVPTGRVAQRTFVQTPEDMEKALAFEEELRAKGKAASTGRMITKSGALKYIEVQGVALPNSSFVTLWTDVTRREIAEAELRESEAKFRTLFEQSSDAVLLLCDDTIIDCNHAAEKLFRTTDRKQIVNSTLKALSPGKQPNGALSAEGPNAFIAQAMKRKSLRFEWQLKCLDGHLFWVDIAMTPIQLQGQKVLYTILRDITAWKKAEQAMRKVRDELEDRVDERTSELRSVNRQLRTEIQRRKQVESELKRSREELRYLSEHLQRAREEERERIAREVHDELGQFLSALKIDVTCLGNTTHLDQKVKDNGKGITNRQLKNPRSFGLAGIRERVRFWGGQSHFEGARNKGTIMTVTIPLTEREDAV